MADCKARIGSETTRCGHTLSVGTHCGAVQSVALMTQSVTHIHRWSIPRQPLAVQTRKQAISSSRWTGIHDVYGTGDRWAGGWRPQWASLARCKHGSPCHSLPESTVTLRIVTSILCAIEIHLLTYLLRQQISSFFATAHCAHSLTSYNKFINYRPRQHGRLCSRLRPSVSSSAFKLSDLWPFARVWAMTIALLGMKVIVSDHGRRGRWDLDPPSRTVF